MNLPNKLTLLRVVLVPIFLLFMGIGAQWSTIIGLVVFVAASITDMLDGKIARSQNLVTTFGKFADPLADKMLTTAAFLVFMAKGYIGPWPIFIILVREFAVSGIRLAAAADGKVIAASMWGKVKTVTQMAAIIIGILLMCIPSITDMVAGLIIQILVWISVLFTIISGIDYIVKNKQLLKLK